MARKKKEELEVVSTKSNILLEEKINTDNIKKELKEYVDEQINKTFFEELEKSNKKLIREKSRKIIWKNIIIILLLLIIGFLLFLMYHDGDFDRFFNKNNIEEKGEKKEDKKEENKENKPEEKKEEKKEEKPKEPTLDELKKEYGSLIDDYYVTDKSIYLSDFYEAKLNSDMRKYMTINSFDFSTFDKEEDYNIIKESTFKTMYEKLFLEEYEASTFNYDDNKLRYVKQMESYMSESVLIREDSNIVREIKDIKVDNGQVHITTVEGIVKDNKIYNVLTNELVDDYKEGNLLKNSDKLNILIYNFKDNKLISLGK